MLIRLTAPHNHNGVEYVANTILDIPTENRDFLAGLNRCVNVTDRGEWTAVLVPAANDLVTYNGKYWFANPANVPGANQAPGVHAGWVLAAYKTPTTVLTNIINELNVRTLRIANQGDASKFHQVAPVSQDDGDTIETAQGVTISP